MEIYRSRSDLLATFEQTNCIIIVWYSRALVSSGLIRDWLLSQLSWPTSRNDQLKTVLLIQFNLSTHRQRFELKMASSMDLLWLFGILVISSVLLETSTLNSEVVESVTVASKSSNFSENVKIKLEKTWNHNGTMQAQPYNILETNCPHGYVLANKHCHKRA